VNVGLQVIQYT